MSWEWLWSGAVLGSAPLEWVAFVAGIIGVVLSIREQVQAWPFLIASTLIYIGYAVLFETYLQGVNLLIYMGLCIYGWIRWRGAAAGSDAGETLQIVAPSRRALFLVGVLWVGLTLAMGGLLQVLGAAERIFLEAFILVGSLIAQWMLARKWLACWGAWVLVNIAAVGLYWLIGMHLAAVLYAVFLGLAVAGWWQWNQRVKVVGGLS